MGTSAVGVDDLAIATYQQGGGFLRQSRITEWLVQALTGLLAYQRFWPEFWAAVCLALAGTGLAAVVYTAAARTPTAGGALLLAGGGLLFPFHAEAFAYSNLCITGLGMLLAVAALAAGWPFVAGGRRTAAAPAACVLLALSVGCYESLIDIRIGCCLCCCSRWPRLRRAAALGPSGGCLPRCAACCCWRRRWLCAARWPVRCGWRWA